MKIWQYSDGALQFAIEKLERQLEAAACNPYYMTVAQYAASMERLEALYDEQDLRRHDLYNVVRFGPYLEAKRTWRAA